MKRSNLLARTLKEAPHDADIISHQLLERAGYLQKLGKGIYIYSPLMWRVIKKLMNIIREELDRVGAQEIALPQLHPAQLWQTSGRWNDYIAEKLLYTLEDREGHPYCLGPTHEEIAVYFVKSWVKSYRELPLNIYQIGNKFRDEIRPRFGLMRCKEFIMKDGYSFSTDAAGMEEHYEKMREAYTAIFRKLELHFVIVEAHGGKISSTGKSQEFQVTAEIGEDAVMVCGDYAANIEAAVAVAPPFTYETTRQPMQKLATPNIKTIDELSTFTKLPAQRILKTLVYKLTYADREEFVAICIRGDRQVNPVKVSSKFGATEIALASDDEVKKVTHAEVGFIGPLNLNMRYCVDRTAEVMTNFVCAANEVDVHYINVNWERDLPQPTCEDFLLAEEGDGCPHIPGGVYHVQRGIEVGHIFNLGTRYSQKLEALFQDEQGNMRPYWMGTYGIGVGRTAQALVEQKHDEKGICWPLCLAPFRIMITAAQTQDVHLTQAAAQAYALLHDFEPLYDDREERLGFKLKDSDLMGIPYKLIVGKSFVQEGKFEIESRRGEKQLVAKEQLLEWATAHLKVCREHPRG